MVYISLALAENKKQFVQSGVQLSLEIKYMSHSLVWRVRFYKHMWFVCKIFLLLLPSLKMFKLCAVFPSDSDTQCVRLLVNCIFHYLSKGWKVAAFYFLYFLCTCSREQRAVGDIRVFIFTALRCSFVVIIFH